MKLKLLLLVQSHQDANLLPKLIPFLRENVETLRVVYSPVVLVDEAAVSREYDIALRDIEEAMDACYKRRDGAGGDAYKQRHDAMVLEKTAKVKDAWKTLTDEAKKAAVDRVFGGFFDAKPCTNMAISEHGDHFEPAAWVEMLNGVNAKLKPVPGTFLIGWPSAMANGAEAPKVGIPVVAAEGGPGVPPLSQTRPPSLERIRIPMPAAPAPAAKAPRPLPVTASPRFKALMAMHIDELGKEAFKAGVKPVGSKLKIVHAVLKAEKTAAEVAAL